MSTTIAAARLDPEVYRPDFPILSQTVHGVPLVYLDNAATSQRPREVIQAIVDTYERHYANVHRGIHWLADQATDLYENARESVERFINAPSREEIVFTSGTTAGINLVARSWGDANVRPGDEVLLTQMEHHSNLVPWHQLAERTGGVRLLGPPPEEKGGIVSFVLDRIHPHDVAQLLDRHGVAIRAGHHCAMPLHRRFGIAASSRASFYFYNTLEEIDRLGEALEQVKHVFQRRKAPQ
jgi:cysteine desulfurase/selenocysteine lyase